MPGKEKSYNVRHWVGRALYELQKSLAKCQQPVLEGINPLIDDLPTEGGKRLFERLNLCMGSGH